MITRLNNKSQTLRTKLVENRKVKYFDIHKYGKASNKINDK